MTALCAGHVSSSAPLEVICPYSVVLDSLMCLVGAALAPSVDIMLIETVDRLHTTDAPLDGMLPIIRRIEGEYDEMPGLTLTEAQARRLWGLDGRSCRLALAALLVRRFLRRTATGRYVRAS